MSDSTPTRRVALGALGVTVIGAAVGAGYRTQTPPKTGGGVMGPTPRHPIGVQVEDALKAAIHADPALQVPASAPSVAPRSVGNPPHPDDPRARPDTLTNRALPSGGVHRSVLYTWTTAEQVEALRKGGRLLHRTHSARHGYSRFDQALRAHPKQGLAPWLLKRENQFRRFAWPYPWATLMGWPGETYGDQLLRIELGPCKTARVRFTATGVLRTTMGERFDSLKGDWSHTTPKRSIGAVYHEHVTYHRPPQNSYMPWGSSLREYVLFSEQHIARFSHGDAACLAALQADIAFLTRLRHQLDRFDTHMAVRGFPKQIRSANDSWRANLAFHNGRYAPKAEAIDAVITRLRSALDAQGPAFARG